MNMTEGILVTPPAGFEVSLTIGSGYGGSGTGITVGAAGTIAETNIYVRLAATATVGSSPYSGNIVCSSSGATSKNVATASSTVSKKALTLSGMVASNKEYDGTTTATLTSYGTTNGIVGVDDVAIDYSGSATNFDTAAVGDGKTVTLSGLTLTGVAAGNYTIANQTTTANITPGAASHVAFETQPSASTVAGVAFAQQPEVRIYDQFTNLVTTATSNVVLTLSTGTGVLGGTTAMDAVGGVADFSGKGLNIDKVGADKVLTATVTGLTTADTSPAFAITPAAADHLAFVQQPSETVAGATIAPAVTVEVLDANTNRVTSYTDKINIRIENNAGGGVLSGLTNVSAVAGLATFSDLSIDKTGISYTLSVIDAAASFATVTSAVFNITAPPAIAPAITNYAATNITMTSAYMNGEVTSTGGAPTHVWLYWGDNDGMDTNDNWDATNDFGIVGTGDLTTNITSGISAGQEYWYRFYATNSAGTNWAEPSANFWSEPTQASGVSFTNVEPGSMMIRWTAGNGGGRIVVVKKDSAVTQTPTDGTNHSADAAFESGEDLGGNEYVVYRSTGTNVTITSLSETTTYHVAVYEYAGSGTLINYQQDSPATNSQTTAAGVSAPTVDNQAGASNVTASSATLSGEVTDNGGQDPTVYIYWGDEDGGTDTNSWDTFKDMGTQSTAFSTNISVPGAGKVYYYRCYAENAGGSDWADWTCAWFVKPIATNTWYLMSAPVHWGNTDSNRLNKTLGKQIATGLDDGGGKFTGDNLWFQDDNKDWHQYYRHTSGCWKDAGDTNATLEISPGKGFWIKRLTSTAETNMVFTGRAHTNSAEITFETNTWTVFGWPYNPRFQNEGWGFANSNATSSYTWDYADNMIGEYNGSQFAIYLRTNGNWCVRGTRTKANVALEPGKAYYYYHRGGSEMKWTAPAP